MECRIICNRASNLAMPSSRSAGQAMLPSQRYWVAVMTKDPGERRWRASSTAILAANFAGTSAGTGGSEARSTWAVQSTCLIQLIYFYGASWPTSTPTKPIAATPYLRCMTARTPVRKICG